MSAQIARPLPVILSNIPEPLKTMRWAVWLAEPREGGKTAKAPRHPGTGKNIGADNPANGATFDECAEAVQSGRFDGLGVLLHEGSGIVGIDIDAVKETAGIYPELCSLLKRAQGEGVYVEKSPSGKGLRLFVQGEMERGGTRTQGIEIYKEKRFLTVTGRRGKQGGTVGPGQWLIDGIVKIISGAQGVGQVPALASGDKPADDATVESLVAQVAKKQSRLWGGDWQRVESDLGATGYPSQSEADMALACEIARLAQREGVEQGALAATVEAVFNKSGLAAREKWTGREDYRERTASSAVNSVLAEASQNTQPQVTPPEETTKGDILNGRMFAKRWRGKYLYVAMRGGWLKWDDTRWVWCEVGEEMQAAKTVAQELMQQATRRMAADPDKGKRLVQHATKTHELNRLQAMLKLASSEEGMAIGSVTELDTHHEFLGTRNGVVNLSTGGLLAPDPTMRITRQCAAAYDRTASCPLWLKFLNDVFGGDQETIDFIQRALGYTLTGSVTEEVLFICYGRGANGKSVFANVLSRILGDYAQVAPSSLLTLRREGDSAPRNDIARLCGVRLAQINELQSGDRLDEQTVKLLAGREKLAARFLHREFFDFWPTAKPWLRTNHRPIVTGEDDGVWRRLKLIPFKHQFSEDEQDPRLEEKLLGERDGILAWMVRGAVEWHREGLKPSELVRRESVAYRKQSDLLGEFLSEHTQPDPGGRVEQKELWDLWRNWCEGSGVKYGSKNSFTRRMSERGHSESKSHGTRYYAGLKMQIGNMRAQQGR